MSLKGKIRRTAMKVYGRWAPVPHPQKWAFIAGATNSGTTLLKHVLSQNPSIATMNREGQHYTDQFDAGKFRRLWAMRPEETWLTEESEPGVDVERVKRQWGPKFNDKRRPVYLEKSPPNALRTRWLQRHFENAHFIGIVRNGYVVAEGIHRKAGHPLDVAAQQWAQANRIMLDDFERLRHKLIVPYEDLTDRPEETYVRICRFLDVDPGPTDFIRNKVWKFQKTRSPIRNMNDRSLQRLSEEDKRIIEAHAGDVLERLGYLERPAAAGAAR